MSPLVSAIAVTLVCVSPTYSQEAEPVPPTPEAAPAPDAPPASPDETPALPEGGPNPGAPGVLEDPLPKPPAAPPPGAVPIRDLGEPAPQNLEEWMEDEASQPPPITEPPMAEPPEETGGTLSREVAMSSALSTGDTLLGSLGGLGGALASPFLTGAPAAPITTAGTPVLRPMRIGSLDVTANASAGVLSTYLGGDQYDDKVSTAALFQGGLSALFGRDRRATIWFSYDLAGSYPENPTQGRGTGSEGGSGGLDHNVSLVGSFVFPEMRRFKFVFGIRYSSLSGLDRDTGESSRRQIATGSFTTNFEYSQKTSFSWDVSVPIRQFSDAVSSTGLTSTLFANTEITRKTSLGLGYTFGSLEVEDGEDQTFHQALLRAKYSPSRFLLFDLTAGMDFRDRGGSSSTTPIFGLSTTWDSRQGTLVTLAAERRIFNAASAVDTNFTSTSVVLSAIQRLDGGVMGTLSAGFEHTKYEAFGGGADSGRTDKLSFVSAGVIVPLSLHWNCSLICSAGRNESEVSEFEFVQMTFKTSLSF